MSQSSPRVESTPLTTCLRLLRELEREIDVATAAIASNRLAKLEDSLWHQEMLSSALRRVVRSLGSDVTDASSRDKLVAAARDLRDRSDAYGKLIVQSRRSAAVLQQLCCLYRDAARRPGKTLPRLMSCEA